MIVTRVVGKVGSVILKYDGEEFKFAAIKDGKVETRTDTSIEILYDMLKDVMGVDIALKSMRRFRSDLGAFRRILSNEMKALIPAMRADKPEGKKKKGTKAKKTAKTKKVKRKGTGTTKKDSKGRPRRSPNPTG